MEAVDTENRFNPIVPRTITSDYEQYIQSKKGKYRTPDVPNPDTFASLYLALGLNGEAGEVAEEIKKWHRDGNFSKERLALELGDVLYYLTRLANLHGFTLKDIMDMNEAKLSARR